MRILVLSQYFWPENFIINDIVRVLDEQGHEVVVATGKPNYPDGKVFSGYRAWGVQHEKYLKRIDVFRVPLWPRHHGGAKNLVFNYLSFVLSGFFIFPWLLRKREFDAIFIFAPSPITQAIPGIFLKWIKGANLVLWIQDLWPESLAATGFVKNNVLLKCVGWMVSAIYKGCDLLLVQSRAFIDSVSRYADPGKVIYYPNSIDNNRVVEGFDVSESFLDLLSSHFCIVFAGNLGTAQSLETLVEMARLVQDDPDIRLVLVGSGSRLDWLHAQKQKLNLNNLILPGRFPVEAMASIFERSSALLVSLSDEPVFAQTIPSKIQAYLAAGRPIIASIDGEGARVILEAKAGLVSPANQVQPLVDNIRALKALSEDERAAMGLSGKDFFLDNFEMRKQVIRLVGILDYKCGF